MMKNTFCPVVPLSRVPLSRLSRLSLSDMMCTQTLMCTFLLKIVIAVVTMFAVANGMRY